MMSMVSLTVLDATVDNARVQLVVRDDEGHTNAFEYSGRLAVNLVAQNVGYLRVELSVNPILAMPPKSEKMENNLPQERFDR